MSFQALLSEGLQISRLAATSVENRTICGTA
jgi:hypothetical protein